MKNDKKTPPAYTSIGGGIRCAVEAERQFPLLPARIAAINSVGSAAKVP